MHIPVLLREVIQSLELHPGLTVLDGTLGAGGHTREILPLIIPGGTLIGLDRDREAVARAEDLIGNPRGVRILIRHANFRDIDTVCDQEEIATFDRALLDLGYSSYQMDDARRGFSFQSIGPLDMRLDQTESITAADIVNFWDEEVIADMIWAYGDERRSRAIARAIVAARKVHPITTTKELADLIEQKIHRSGKIHPATKTFQALRIVVNDEMASLRTGIEHIFTRLVSGGRLAIISFHSGEDRIVKDLFRTLVTDGRGALVVKKPLVPQDDEFKSNPRSRSAKLRIIQKL